MKDFLSRIVMPVTGHIYNGVSRFYPEYKNKPKVRLPHELVNITSFRLTTSSTWIKNTIYDLRF